MPTAAIIPLPAPRAAAPPAAAPAVAASRRRYRLHDMARLMALDELAPRTLIDTLRRFARLDGMPVPLNPRTWGTTVHRGADAICKTSLWDAAQVDAWLARPAHPAAARAAGTPATPPALRDALRHRAADLAASARDA